MAVVLIRVDQRLLHGQVVEGWVPHLKIDTVVVADDAIANDPILQVAMGAACPSKVKLQVMRVSDAGASLPGKRTLVLVATVGALEKIWKAGFRAEQVNLGNVPIAPGRARVTSSVALSKDEVHALDEIAATGVPVEARAVPREKPVDLRAIHDAVERAT